MLTLTLLRHAKSSWVDASLGDFDRPLAARGEEAAPRMGAFLIKRGLIPDLVMNGLSSVKGREQCGRIDRAADLLSPLPPRNLAGLVVLGVEIATVEESRDLPAGKAKGKAKAKPASKAPLICPAARS